jgi:hypothetical protein
VSCVLCLVSRVLCLVSCVLCLVSCVPRPYDWLTPVRRADFGFTTLLATNGTPGLEVYSQGSWHPVEPEQGAFIVNIGDALSRLSGGKYKSSLHRVINNTGPKARYSIPCFLGESLRQCVRVQSTLTQSHSSKAGTLPKAILPRHRYRCRFASLCLALPGLRGSNPTRQPGIALWKKIWTKMKAKLTSSVVEGNLDFVVKPLDAPARSDERFPTVEDLLRARHQETFSTTA